MSDEILLEYNRVLARPGVRRPLAGKIVNLLREDAELVQPLLFQKSHLIPEMLRSLPALKPAAPTSCVTLNLKGLPHSLLSAHVIRRGGNIPTTARRKRGVRAVTPKEEQALIQTCAGNWD